MRGLPLALAVLAFACESGPHASGPVSEPDAGTDPEEFVPTPPATPAPPHAPVMTPCPEGWREVTDRDDASIVTCDPWPESGYQTDCAVDEAHFPGTPGCARIGTACPEGDFAGDLAASGVVYVRAGEPAGGDGTRERPMGTIADAIAIAVDGDVVALSKGTFDEAVVVERAVTLRGACVAETIVAASAPAFLNATIALGSAGGMALENLQVGGVEYGIAVLGNLAPAGIDEVLVQGASIGGVVVWGGASLVASGLVVRDTAPRSDGPAGIGIFADSGAHVEISRAVLERNHDSGFEIDGGSDVFASDVAVRDTRPRPNGWFGDGIRVQDSSLEISRSVLEGNAVGLPAVGESTRIVATDLVVRDLTGAEPWGRGIELGLGATAELTRVLVDRSGSLGLFANGGTTELTATDVIVRDAGSSGLVVQTASVRLERAVFLRNRRFGVIDNFTGVLDATDVTVRGTVSGEAETTGIGLGVYNAASARVERAFLERNAQAGVAVHTPEGVWPCELHATDLVVEDTQAGSDGGFGNGIGASRSTIELSRAVFRGNRNFGLQFNGGTAVLEDLVVEGTIEEEIPREGGDGNGIAVFEIAAVDVTRFRISQNVRVGVQLDDGGTIDLHDGEVSGNAVGANVETDDFDFRRLQDRVLYTDNEVNLDTADLPLPNAIGGVEEEL